MAIRDDSPADIARRNDERQFGRDLEMLAPALRAWSDRARRFELHGLQERFLEAAEAAASWGHGLQED